MRALTTIHETEGLDEYLEEIEQRLLDAVSCHPGLAATAGPPPGLASVQARRVRRATTCSPAARAGPGPKRAQAEARPRR